MRTMLAALDKYISYTANYHRAVNSYKVLGEFTELTGREEQYLPELVAARAKVRRYKSLADSYKALYMAFSFSA